MTEKETKSKIPKDEKFQSSEIFVIVKIFAIGSKRQIDNRNPEKSGLKLSDCS